MDSISKGSPNPNGGIIRKRIVASKILEYSPPMNPEANSIDLEDEFHSAFKHAAIGMALVSPLGQFLRVNEALTQIVGYSSNELLGFDFQKITHSEDLEIDLFYVREMLNGLRSAYQMEKRYIHKNGSLIWAQLNVSLIKNPDQSPKYFISQIQDITVAKNAVEALKEREEQLSLFVNTTHDGIWDWYIKDDYEYMSPRFWMMLGYEPEEKKHHPSEWQRLIFPEDLERVKINFERHIETRGNDLFYQEVRYLHKNGKTIWVICRGKVVEWAEDGTPIRIIGSHTDITELKSAQESLIHSSKMVALGEMAGGIAHEINNPLTIIKGHSDRIKLLLKKEKKDLEAVESSVLQINLTVERISKIISGLKNFSRDSSEVQFDSHPLIVVIHDSLALCQEKLKKHSISIEIEGDQTLEVFCSRVQISQVILNLINNSFYAIQKLPKKWIRIHIAQIGSQAKVSIVDSGMGIRSDIRSKIMDPFFTTKPIGEGTGLGLSISRGILENHLGHLTLDEESLHTKFDFGLPIFVKN
jgi:PAS domain S-box-containing protein